MRAEAASWVARGVGLAIGVLLVLLLTALTVSTRDVILLVFIAVLLGAALEPVVGWIRGRIPIGRGIAILVVYVAFLALVVAISVFVVPTALVQLTKALAGLPTFLQQVRGWTNSLQPEALSQGLASLLDAVEAPFKPGPPPSPESIVGVSVIVGQAAAAVVTLLALVFFWLTERPRLQRYALAFAPADRRGGIRDAWNEIESRLGLWVRGQLTLMATIGVATGIAYSVIGLPAALLLALIAAIMEIIPIVGPLLGAIPAVLIATTISTETALITMGIYLLLQIIEGNVLVPIVMRNSVGLSPFLVLLSLLLGGTAGGILGAVVAVPIVAGITVVLERLQDRDTPVPIDPTAVTSPDEETKDEMEEQSPSSKKRSAAASS
ncbi:MAG TPA: AI-2E family transporter [Candidatus Limnocylindrales bacterium]|nr:AI-2E family transporter [Candidatus Limnocylindrales bacterium]